MRSYIHISIILLVLLTSGCDRIYGLLHKPGGEERAILGDYVFNVHSPKVEELQKILKFLGYNIGRPDGKYGPGTREAVAQFQADEGLEVNRFVDKKTWKSLTSYAGSAFFHNGQLSGKAVQQALRAAGYDPGTIDGQLGKQSQRAIKNFQLDRGLEPDGHVGLKTIKALSAHLPGPKISPSAGAEE